MTMIFWYVWMKDSTWKTVNENKGYWLDCWQTKLKKGVEWTG